MSESVRWGVISTANIGRAAVNPAIQASRNGELVGVASRDGARARAFADEHSIPEWYGTYEELIEDASIDAVYIPLPNSMHKEWTLRAIEAGKHVLCEKPLAMDESECLEMHAAAEEKDVRLMEAFMYRFHPRTEQVVDWVRSGRLGDIGSVRSTFTFRLARPDNIRLDPELGGGALMDVGCYCVNVARTLTGEEPVEVVAIADWTDRGVDSAITGIMRFRGGAVAHFDAALTMERCEVYEVAGVDGFFRVPASFLPGTDPIDFEEVRGRDAAMIHRVDGADEYQRMVEHFADCVLTGSDPRYSALEAAANMRAIGALYESARAGGMTVRV